MGVKEKTILELQKKVDCIQKVADRVSPLEERLDILEKRNIASKDILTLQEAAVYMGISLSQIYKLTSTQTIPHYKPRGKMCYFEKKELDAWLLRNHSGPDMIINNEQKKRSH